MKQSLRQSALQGRSALTSEEIEGKSRFIVDRLLAMPAYAAASTVMIYVDFRQEVLTGEILSQSLRLGKTVAVPICQPATRHLIAGRIDRYPDDLRRGTWGIMEPVSMKPVPPAAIDLVVIPGVAFDRLGNRLGYGAGYYDRFLPSLRADAQKIALAFDLQIVKEIHPDDHDIPMDQIITESQVIDCREERAHG
ncbi:5-formyltetrahydrofolate cyclo-ligase [Heliobacterium gestii]|uniref:5-formyltetrahydrofolate cyclo-ligase n=1 Tax=Heliomicrobium gestii TaxID=2699 RepID=A0A845LC80_HELGE|nr:5-formyltetrahydrofolate cyclo-ligase [Heliomicrobium gestii]MBM7866143.1 5-formyltetrahydrofolate cyclo-ligase [Heliomicrobium gestii]MZP42530.1 5-formyltetrahydrofolate cyclo-ligase [Heliomicrobium gestii]